MRQPFGRGIVRTRKGRPHGPAPLRRARSASDCPEAQGGSRRAGLRFRPLAVLPPRPPVRPSRPPARGVGGRAARVRDSGHRPVLRRLEALRTERRRNLQCQPPARAVARSGLAAGHQRRRVVRPAPRSRQRTVASSAATASSAAGARAAFAAPRRGDEADRAGPGRGGAGTPPCQHSRHRRAGGDHSRGRCRPPGARSCGQFGPDAKAARDRRHGAARPDPDGREPVSAPAPVPSRVPTGKPASSITAGIAPETSSGSERPGPRAGARRCAARGRHGAPRSPPRGRARPVSAPSGRPPRAAGGRASAPSP